MQKIILSLVVVGSLYGNSEFSYQYGAKEYDNSKYKTDGVEQTFGLSYNYGDGKISGNFSKDSVNLKAHPKSTKLEVEKSNLNLRHNLLENLSGKVSYIGIRDNLSPTDGGKVYGIGGRYDISKGLGVSLDIYKSDYKTFDVNQYDMGIFKGFTLGEVKSKVTFGIKSIHIDGDKYATYTFKDKEYQTSFINFNGNYQGYFGGVGAMFGKRLFAVLDDGNKVQHHAMEQDKTYMFSFGKTFKDFDIVAQYNYQNGKELPENQDDVDTKVTSLMLKYKF
ncbi:MAG: hypothetical protein RBT59_07800 [Arcobacteraceae bacterium]|nr:hypothetical protein [Arcobacteraceae bacterium]